ncbi:MAG: hypothetical protein WBJ08_02890, partial [Kiritimatiellia bacterium]
ARGQVEGAHRRAAASRPVTDGHESSPDRPQSGIIEKSGGYFCEEPRQNPNESLCTTSCGRRARQGSFLKPVGCAVGGMLMRR